MAFFKHETAIVDAGAVVGDGTKIWHFSHVMADCVIGDDCNLGQNVVISPKVRLGRGVTTSSSGSRMTAPGAGWAVL